jgi:hypothetical protein
MYLLDKYFKDISILSNSLIVKFTDVAIAMNKGIYLSTGVSPSEDRTQWKYYLNLAGEKHITNSDVKIILRETSEEVSLTKDILASNEFTLTELLKNETYYNELINSYPNDILYIHGCMYPVDIEKAIAAKDGTILNYNKSYVEENEYSLIKELEIYIKSFISRYHVNAYTLTDELYLPSMLAVLYSSIPDKIQNIRLNKLNTNEVHSFHLEHFFRSRFDLWNDIQVLKPATRFWLYRNLEYILKHIGKESTFKLILTKIFEENNIGVGEYKLRVPDVDLVYGHDSNVMLSSYVKDEVMFMTKALNNKYILDRNTEVDTETVVNLELTKLTDLTPSNLLSKNDYITKNVKEILSDLNYDNQKSKILDLNTNKLFKSNGVDIYLLIIDYWMYSIKYNKYDALIEYSDPNVDGSINSNEQNPQSIVNFTDPNTNQHFKVTPKIGFLMLIKLLLNITGNENIKMTKVSYTTIISSDASKIDKARSVMYDDKYSDDMIDIMKKHLPASMYNLNKPEEFSTFMENIINYYKLIWVLDSNSENTIVSSNIKYVFNNILEADDYIISPDGNEYTIDEILAKNNIYYELNDGFDLSLSVKGIIKAFTNYTVDEYDSIEKAITSYSNILNKLTSYTTQVVTSSDDESSSFVYYNNINNLRTKNGLIKVMDASLTPLEQEYVFMKGMANDFKDIISHFQVEHESSVTKCIPPITGLASISYFKNDISAEIFKPHSAINLENELVCDILPIEMIDHFLLGVTGKIDHTLEPNFVSSKTEAIDSDVKVAQADFIDISDTNNVSNPDKIIDGILEVITQSKDITASMVNPENVINILQDPMFDIRHLEFVEHFLLGVTGQLVNTLNESNISIGTVGTDTDADLLKASYDAYSGNNIIRTPYKYIEGTAELSNQFKDLFVTLLSSVSTIEITDKYTYDIRNLEFIENFLFVSKAKIANTLNISNFTLGSAGTDIEDGVEVDVVTDINYEANITTPEAIIDGTAEIVKQDNDIIAEIVDPTITIDIRDKAVYDIKNLEYIENFLLGVSAIIANTLNTNTSTLSSDGNDLLDESLAEYQNNDTTSVKETDIDIKGISEIDVATEDNLIIDIDSPVMAIEVTDK